MGLISIGGLGSGLDVKAIVDALVAAERAPKENSLNRTETDVTFTLTGLGGLSSAMDEIRNSALNLSLSTSFDKRSVSVSDKNFLTATATTTATPGNYQVEVLALAQSSFHKSKVFTGGDTTTFGTGGTLTFTVGAKSFDLTVSATDTLVDIRNNINALEENDLVNVNLLSNVTLAPDTGSVLTFDSSTLGAGNDLVVTFSGDASLADLSSGLTQTQNAGDASIKVDGFVATSDTNTFANTINGVSIVAKKVQDAPGDTEKVTVALDTTSTKTLISGFVEAYNAYVDVTKQLGSAESTNPGLLLGDFTLRQVSSQLRGLLSNPVTSVSGAFNSLSAIGITTTQDGHLEINNETLDSAIATDFDQFNELFASENGFATKLRSLIDGYTNSSGIITTRETALNAQLGRIADDRIALNLKIESLQLRLTSQFATMDALVAQMNSTQSYLTQQFENLPGFGGSKK